MIKNNYHEYDTISKNIIESIYKKKSPLIGEKIKEIKMNVILTILVNKI